MSGKAKDRLTLRERKLISGIAKGLTISEAARRAGYSENTIDDRVHEILGRSRVKQALDRIFESMGLTDEQLAMALKAGLEATKLLPMTAANASSTKTYLEVPDFLIRHRYLEIALFLKGHRRNCSSK